MQSITYTDKSALNENISIADTNKCNATDMNEIKTVVNANATETTTTFTTVNSSITALNTSVDNLCSYSTTEVNTGKKWINNKPIYRKVISATTGNTAGDLQISHGINNVDKFIKIEGFTNESYQRFFPNFYSDFQSQYALIVYYANATTVLVSYGSSRTNISFYLILEYTKTTD